MKNKGPGQLIFWLFLRSILLIVLTIIGLALFSKYHDGAEREEKRMLPKNRVVMPLSKASNEIKKVEPNIKGSTEFPKSGRYPTPGTLKQSQGRALEEGIEFPKDFFFGTAYSDFQTTGLSPTSDWAIQWDEYAKVLAEDFKKKGLKDRRAIHPGLANDFFNKYKEDFDLAGHLGIQVHRISLEWSRFEPEEGKWDLKMVRKYREIFAYMKRRGIEPMICLNHFPLPNWFAKLGSWENPKAPYYYARYAEFIAKNLGAPLEIKWWLTFNEPQFVISVPYAKAGWPPFKGIEDLKDSAGTHRLAVVVSRVFDSHRLAYRAIHRTLAKQKIKPMVGIASAVGAFYPQDPKSEPDRLVANAYNALHTLLLDYTLGATDRDFIGLNYYGRNNLVFHIPSWRHPLAWLGEKPFTVEWDPDPEKRIQDNRPKEFYPEALYEMIMKFKDLGLPIIITENGLDDDSDKFREEFIVIHLKAVHNAIRDGADVIGYQYWSLADTWEPGDAQFSQMGLIKIDRKNNLARSIRPSALTYAEIIKTKTIKKELLEKYKKLLP